MTVRELIVKCTFAESDAEEAIYLAELKKISWMF